ncbi:MAG: hypothetical protein LBU14_05185 [Candidatus Peribacteria bacterium]|jgi:hypothetical protein|nr:hypothetical protein [Candidatus Peribacteria bacterium]
MANFFRKIILTDFFTTVGVKAFFVSLVFLTIKLPFLRKGRDVEKLEIELLKFLDAKNSKILSFYN